MGGATPTHRYPEGVLESDVLEAYVGVEKDLADLKACKKVSAFPAEDLVDNALFIVPTLAHDTDVSRDVFDMFHDILTPPESLWGLQALVKETGLQSAIESSRDIGEEVDRANARTAKKAKKAKKASMKLPKKMTNEHLRGALARTPAFPW